MKKFLRITVAKSIVLTLSAATGTMAIGQAASAGEYWVPSAAPITYKMANPADMTGFVPQTAAPSYAPRPQQVQAPTQAPMFDQRLVDTTLYAHQGVGRTYTVAGKSYTPKHEPSYDMVGTASWYGDKFHGKLTASGEKYNKNAMTAAHKTLPLNSLVVVTNMKTGVGVTLRINDRGPFIGERIIDLSEAAASFLGIRTVGLGDVRVQYAGPAPLNKAQAPTPVMPEQPAQQAQRPVAPAPAPAPTVQPQQNQYQPLRDLGQRALNKATPHASLGQPQLRVPNIINPVTVAPQLRLPAQPQAIPQAYVDPSQDVDDGVVTLTIKGPIHMAKHQSTDPQPRFIPAVNRTAYKTVK